MFFRWGRPDQRKYGSASTSDSRLNSILYDDYGRFHTFEFDLPRGLYDVTVSVGWNGRTYKNNTVNVNGVQFFNVETTNVSVPYMNRTKQIYCYSNKLFLEMGDGKDYTMLNYLIIKLNTTNIGFNYFTQKIAEEKILVAQEINSSNINVVQKSPVSNKKNWLNGWISNIMTGYAGHSDGEHNNNHH